MKDERSKCLKQELKKWELPVVCANQECHRKVDGGCITSNKNEVETNEMRARARDKDGDGVR